MKRSVVGEQLVLEVIAERTEWVIRGTIRDATGPVHRPEADPGWYGTSTFPPPTP